MQGSHYNDVTLRGGARFEADFIATEIPGDAIQSSIRRVDMVCEQVLFCGKTSRRERPAAFQHEELAGAEGATAPETLRQMDRVTDCNLERDTAGYPARYPPTG